MLPVEGITAKPALLKIFFVAVLTNLSTLLYQIILGARSMVIEVSDSWYNR